MVKHRCRAGYLLPFISGLLVLAGFSAPQQAPPGPNPNPSRVHLVQIDCQGGRCCAYDLATNPGFADLLMKDQEEIFFFVSGKPVTLVFRRISESGGEICVAQASGECETLTENRLQINPGEYTRVRVAKGDYCVICENCDQNICDRPSGKECEFPEPIFQTVPVMRVVAK